MTIENNTAATEDVTEDVQETDTPGEQQPDDDTEQDTPESPNREAAKWRTKFRAAEQERDQLTERITGIENSIIGHALSTAGVDPRLWELSNVDLDELRGDDGHLDITAVIDRVQQIRSEVYGSGPRPNPQQGNPSLSHHKADMAEQFEQARHATGLH